LRERLGHARPSAFNIGRCQIVFRNPTRFAGGVAASTYNFRVKPKLLTIAAARFMC
jgi:hypothetical protein